MREGVYSLATIACVAPWVGLFGTILGIVNSFPGIAGDRTATMAAIFRSLSDAMWPTALGLMAGVLALCFYRYPEGRLEALDHEMRSASLELQNKLSRLSRRFSAGPEMMFPRDGPMFAEKPLAELRRDEKFWRR